MSNEPNPQLKEQQSIEQQISVPANLSGKRLDQVASLLFPQFSRSRLQKWIEQGQLLLDGRQVKRRERVYEGMLLELNVQLEAEGDWQAQPVEFETLYRDESILVVNKPAGLVVHPAAGNPDGTLLNGLLYQHEKLREIPRAGIVHRLDKDTSGLMVVACSLQAQASLVSQLQERSVKRQYQAICQGGPRVPGTIDQAIGRHAGNRLKMAVRRDGKSAITHYTPLQQLAGYCHLQVQLDTGRTHQIRVHMAHQGWPLLGDPLYGKRPHFPPGTSAELRQAIESFKRQALHAEQLALDHPASGERMQWQVPLPQDMQAMLDLLRTETLREG